MLKSVVKGEISMSLALPPELEEILKFVKP